VKDCWACAGNSYSLNELFTNPQIWNDEAHLSLILHKYAKQVGAGVTEKDGSIYYDLVISFDWGTAPNNTDITPATLPTHSTTPQVVPVIVSTPKADGSISHVVQPGQALWSIAIAYGVTVEQLRLLNNFSSTATNIYAGETLLIRTAYTPTALPSITPTPRQPTRTPVPAQAIETLQPVQPTEEPASAPSFLAGLDRTTTGLLLVLLSGIGLVLIIMGTLRRKR
jgi:LysM repeat protein